MNLSPKIINKHTHWWCKCICGKKVLVKADSLRSGKSRSCGCKKLDLRFENTDYNSYTSTIKRAFNNYKRGTKRRKIRFDLTLEQFYKLTQNNCSYCGTKPNTIFKRKYKNGKDFIYNGIDR